MEIDRLYESIYSFSFKKNILKEGTLDVTDISGTSTFKSKKLPTDKYFIVHHTAGRGQASDVINVLNSRGLGIHWIIDREGKLYKGLPSSVKGAHVKSFYPSVPKDLNNSSSQGVEIIANDDTDILIPQCKTALKLVKSLGYPLSNIYGHGEVSTNKMKEEGKTCKAYITKYWGTPESELPDSDPTLGNVGETKKSEEKKPEKKKPEEKKPEEKKTDNNKKPVVTNFCQCLKNEKNTNTQFKFLDAGKKCDPTKGNDEILNSAKDCLGNVKNQEKTDQEKKIEKEKTDIGSFNKLLGLIFREEKVLKDVKKVKKIFKKTL